MEIHLIIDFYSTVQLLDVLPEHNHRLLLRVLLLYNYIVLIGPDT